MIWHTGLATSETSAHWCGTTRLGTVVCSLCSRGVLLGDGLHGRLGDIGVVLGVT